MRRRFFVDSFEAGRVVMLGEAAHHVGRVLRAQVGQQYELSDGEHVWLGTIDRVSRESVEFALNEELPAYRPEVHTTLLASIVKFDAFEWALEKATELSVARIVPVAAERTEKGLLAAAAKRADRWRKLLLEASQQSRRLRVPELVDVQASGDAFQEQREGLRVLLSEEPSAPPLRQLLQGQKSAAVVLATGPEGGWTEREFAAARHAGWAEASLGKQILRAETAIIAGLACVNYALAAVPGE